MKAGLIQGIDYTNKVSIAGAASTKSTVKYFFLGTTFATDLLLYGLDSKSANSIYRDNTVDLIKPPGLKGDVAGEVVKEGMNFYEKNAKENK